MKKALIFALAFSCLAFGLSRSTFAQDNVTQKAVSVTAESGSREQDKLSGPVRRVRVETASIIPKNGNWVEGPREVRGITTYDRAGKKIDSVAYPVESSSLSGREEYLYDNKGNVVEMILLGPDGSMLSKESYKYEFDQLGNWTKRSSSVAVYENGKIIFEPTAITYRTISYYYNQAIERLNAPSAKSKGVSAPSASSTLLPDSTASVTRPSPPDTQVGATSQPMSETANAHAKTELVTAPASVSPAKTETGNVAASVSTTNSSTPASESSVEASGEIRTSPDSTSVTSVVQRVAEEDLLKAAIDLPKPEYSAAALVAKASGKVTVQILVDETGQVTTAQATGGHPLLGASAEAAARKARFAPGKLSSGATKVYGVLSYDFVPPPATREVSLAASPTIERASSQPGDRKPEVKAIPDPAALVESKPKAVTSHLETAKSFYEKGLAFHSAGRFGEAAETFNQMIKVNPNDAKAYAGLGMAYSALQKHKDAIVVYKMALQINGSVLGAPAYYMWGHSYLALDKPADALAAFKQSLDIKRAEALDPERKEIQRYPSLEELHYGLGFAYLNSRRFAQAIDELKQVVKLNPKNAAGHYTLALAYLANGNRRDAESHHKMLSSINPNLAQKLTIALTAQLPPGCRNVLRCP